jgi:hypothetical protein
VVIALTLALGLTLLPAYLLDRSGCLGNAGFATAFSCLVGGSWLASHVEAQNALVAGGGALLACLFLGPWYYWRFRRERELFRFGKVAKAEILGERVGLRNEDYEPVTATIIYRFVDARGKICHGSRRGVPIHRGLNWMGSMYDEIYSHSTVVYDPLDSGRSTLYPPALLNFR